MSSEYEPMILDEIRETNRLLKELIEVEKTNNKSSIKKIDDFRIELLTKLTDLKSFL